MSSFEKDSIETEFKASGFKKIQEDILGTSKRVNEYRDALKKLEYQQYKLISAKKQDSEEYQNTVAEIAKNKAALEDEIKSRKKLFAQLKVGEMSYNQLKNRASDLRRELYNTSQAIAPQEYNNLRHSLKICEDQMDKLRIGMRKATDDIEKTPGIWANAWSKVKNYMPALGIGSAIDWMASKVRNFISGSVDEFRTYDEALVDAMKTTGFSKDQIKDISDELSKIDTRTTQNNLLGLARIAGKLGKNTKDAVVDFVEGADIVGVALSEDLGGNVETAINEIGKLIDIFDAEKDFGLKNSMIKIGSTINALGAASTANEGYIVDFSKRVAGIAPNADISIQSVIGLAATLDKYGQQSETSSTVYGQTINGMFTDPAKHAKLAGMEVKAFTNLLNTDANVAFIALLKGLRGNDAAMMSIANNLDDMEVRGARGAQVLGTLIKNVDELESQQNLANKAFEEGTSVINEYNTKNNSAEAQSEKLKKQMTEQAVILGEKLTPIVNSAATGLLYYTKIMAAIIGCLIESKGAIIAVAVVTAGYITVKKISLFYSVENRKAVLREAVAISIGTKTTEAYTLGQKALIAVKSLLIGQFRAAGIAAKAFFVSLGPIGWAVTAIGLFTGGMALFGRKTNEVTTETAKMVLELNQEKSTYEDLLSAVNNTKEGTQERADVIKLINERYPEYLGSLLTEKNSTQDIITALTAANSKMEENIRLKLKMSQYQSIMQQQLDVESSVMGSFMSEFNYSGTKTNEQQKLFIADLAAIIEKAREGKATMDDARKILIAFGEDKDRVENTMTSSDGPVAKKLRSIYGSLRNIQQAAKDAVNAKQSIDLLIGDSGNSIEPKGSGEKCSKCGKTPCECFKAEAEEKQKWTMENDKAFGEQVVAMKRKRLAGDYATEDEYSRDLLALEVRTLEDRIAANRDKGEDLIKLKGQLLDRQLTQAKDAQKREEELRRVALDGKIASGGEAGHEAEREKARRERDERLKALGLTLKAEHDMTVSEKEAKLAVEREYSSKLVRLDLTRKNKEIERLKTAAQEKVAAIKQAQDKELSSADTLEKKKAILKQWYSDEELRNVTSSEEAVKLIRAKYADDQNAKMREELMAIAETYKEMVARIKSEGGLLGGTVKLTEDELAQYQEVIKKLQTELDKLKPKGGEQEKIKDKTDVFGMSVGDWKTLFENTDGGLTALEKMVNAAKAIGSAFSDVSNLMAAIEQRELKQFEKTQNKKKQALDRQLSQGLVSQENYNARVRAIDEQTDAKREEMERKQAERQKMLAIFNAIISTALSVVKALEAGPLLGPILAGVVGALGAVQIATIAATPLPGAEQGGMLIERAQDGKRYDALYEPNRRGAISRPTVLVGENGTEYVVPADGYANPTIAPVLDIIESARRSGALKSLNLTSAMQRVMMPGRADGGSFSSQPTKATSNSDNFTPTDNNDRGLSMAEQREMLQVLRRISDRLDNPVPAKVAMTGSEGLARQFDKYNSLRDRSTIGRRKQP